MSTRRRRRDRKRGCVPPTRLGADFHILLGRSARATTRTRRPPTTRQASYAVDTPGIDHRSLVSALTGRAEDGHPVSFCYALDGPPSSPGRDYRATDGPPASLFSPGVPRPAGPFLAGGRAIDLMSVSQPAQHDSCKKSTPSSDGDAKQRIAGNCALELRSLSTDSFRRLRRGGGKHLGCRRHLTVGSLFKLIRRRAHYLPSLSRLKH